MNQYKIFAYTAIALLFFIYRSWLKKEITEGRGHGILHKDISAILLLAGLVGLLIYFFVD